MRPEEWQAAAKAEAIHTGDEAWAKDFRRDEVREIGRVAAALALTALVFFFGVAAIPAGWGIAAAALWLLLVGFALGRKQVGRDAAWLFGLLYGSELYSAHPGKEPEWAPRRPEPYSLILTPFGKIHCIRNLFFGAVLLAVWLSWQNVVGNEGTLSIGAVLCICPPGLCGWRTAQGAPWPWQRRYWEVLKNEAR